MHKYIIKELDEYISKENLDGAFYLSGKWGSGKSYFINNYIGKKDEYCYISLNGMTSTSQIDNQLIYCCHPKFAAIKDKKTFNLAENIFSVFLKSKNIEADSIVNSFMSSTLDINFNKIKVLFLDDLERTRIDIQELFGYISNLLGANVKVVIIGYDEEVKRYLQSKQRNVDKVISAIVSSSDVKKYKENINLVKEPLLYESIKEKVVYKENVFIFDEDILFKEIIKKYKKTTKKILNKNKEFISALLKYYECENLRTCKAALDNYEKIVNKVRYSFNNDNLIKTIIFNTIFEYTIMNKSGRDDEYKNIQFFSENIISSEHLRNFVYYGIWNRNGIINDLKQMDDSGENSDRDYPEVFTRLSGYWLEKDENQLIQDIHVLYEEITSYEIKYYKRAIYFLTIYKSWFNDSTISIDELIEKMEIKIKSYVGYIEYYDDDIYDINDDEKIKLFNKLDEMIDEHNLEVDKDINNKFVIDFSNFSDKDIAKIKDKSLENRCFMSTINIDNLIKVIDNGDNENVVKIKRIMKSVYSFSNLNNFYKSDLKSLKELKERLRQLETNSTLKKLAIDALVQDVDGYIKK